MKKTGYKILLEVLKVMVVLKRIVSWCWYYIRTCLFKLDELVRNSVGYRLYAWQKRLQKYTAWFGRFQDGRIIEFIGERRTLQIVFVIVLIVIFVPHSKLYSRSTIDVIPGRNTLLYQVVGPGDQNFELQEVVVTEIAQQVERDNRSWREGAVTRGVESIGGNQTSVRLVADNIATTHVGGGALLKPIIAPGGVPTVTVTSEEEVPEEKSIVRYIVQPGDVLGSIAQQFGVSVETILWANDLTSRSVIRPGDELIILPTTGVVHRVKSGDTFGKIARLYDAEIGDIMQENNISAGMTLQIGQELIIPGGRQISSVVRTPVVPQAPAAIPTPTPSQPTVPSVPPPASTDTPASSGYIWPTSVRTITQYYGWRHTGVDIAGPIGSPLYAARTGTVIKSQCGWNGGYGCYIILDHGDGVQTLYGHASELYVSVGDTVMQGETIALMGSTGRSTGPHIHFEVRVGSSRLNPLQYVK